MTKLQDLSRIQYIVGINKNLSFRELMFGFDGRIGRLALLKYAGILGISLFVFCALSSTLLHRLDPVLQRFGLSAISVSSAVAVWPAAAIVCKRLHDMKSPLPFTPGRQAMEAGRSDIHSIAVCSLLFIPLGSLHGHWVTADIAVISILATWLALAPGTSGPSFHGLSSGMRVDRIIEKPRSGT
jgi:uncharacterized membrane protein YhaH (DUF805 family)